MIVLSSSIRLSLGLMLGATALSGLPAMAQSQAESQVEAKVIVQKIVVHGKSLEGNLEGNPAEREVTVFLPADYHSNPSKRYPVVYGLHGYSVTDDIFARDIGGAGVFERAYAKGMGGIIFVVPNANSLHNGSMYSSSVTTGDWESFITDDLVDYIDTNYRTIPNRESRGLMGHSMGGYGTIRIGMKNPEVFGALYIMAPCCMPARGAPPQSVLTELRTVETKEETVGMDFMRRATLAVASAWSPNPHNPPLFVDLPTGEPGDPVIAQWAANAPLAMVDQYMFNLRQYKAIALDVGDRDDFLTDTEVLYNKLNSNGVTATFEVHEGDHGSGIAVQFETKVLPFFAKHLSTE